MNQAFLCSRPGSTSPPPLPRGITAKKKSRIQFHLSPSLPANLSCSFRRGFRLTSMRTISVPRACPLPCPFQDEGQAAYETFSRCAGVHFVCACWPLAPCLWVTRVTPLVGANLQMSAEGRGCAAGARLLVAPLGRGERRPASDDRVAPLGLADRPVDPAQPPLRSLPRSRSLLPGSCFSVAAQPGSQSPLEPVST